MNNDERKKDKSIKDEKNNYDQLLKDDLNESIKKDSELSLKNIKIANVKTTFCNFYSSVGGPHHSCLTQQIKDSYWKIKTSLDSGKIVDALSFCETIITSLDNFIEYDTHLIQSPDTIMDTYKTYQTLDDFCKLIEKYTVEDEMMVIFKRALKIREVLLEKYYISIANMYSQEAGENQNVGNYDRAIEYYKKALCIRKIKLGCNYPDTAETHYYLARVFEEQDDFINALENYNIARSIINKIQGTDYRFLATVYYCIGRVYIKKRDYKNAVVFYRKTLSIYNEKLGPNHPDTKYILKRIDELNKLLVFQDLYEEHKGIP